MLLGNQHRPAQFNRLWDVHHQHGHFSVGHERQERNKQVDLPMIIVEYEYPEILDDSLFLKNFSFVFEAPNGAGYLYSCDHCGAIVLDRPRHWKNHLRTDLKD